MARVKRQGGAILLEVDETEQKQLTAIIHHLSRFMDTSWKPPHHAYEDPKLQEEYDLWVLPTVTAGRKSDLDVVLATLTSSEHVYLLTEDEVYAWIRLTNHLRHAAGDMLGITEDDWSHEVDGTYGSRQEFRMLIALGWLEEELISALETW